MTKKIYNAPYFKVVEVKNDIIATSNEGGFKEGEGNGENSLAPGRNFFGEDEF